MSGFTSMLDVIGLWPRRIFMPANSMTRSKRGDSPVVSRSKKTTPPGNIFNKLSCVFGEIIDSLCVDIDLTNLVMKIGYL